MEIDDDTNIDNDMDNNMDDDIENDIDDICYDLKDMSVTGYFKYGLKEQPETVFSNERELLFALHHTCRCYDNCHLMRRLTIYVSVKSEEKITYGKIFDEIEKQVKDYYTELSLIYGISLDRMYCDHRVIIMFLINRKNQYDIVCGR